MTTALWDKLSLTQALGPLILKPLVGPWEIHGISIDSRTVQEGDLFFALKGPYHDGHHYVQQALDRGARGVVVSAHGAQDPTYALQVSDVMQALRTLGNYGRQRSRARIIAITGSAGKTGTKEALYTLLSTQGPTAANIASYNNHLGVPLSLARLPAHAQYGIFEIGTNHPGEIQPLAELIKPHVALITTVAPAHIGFFSSQEAIAREKAQIFRGLAPGGTAIFNHDDETFCLVLKEAQQAQASQIYSFGAHNQADFRLVDYTLHATYSQINALIQGEQWAYTLSQPGRHWGLNSVAILAVIKALGLPIKSCLPVMNTFKALKGRGKCHTLSLKKGGSITLLDECYNANPASMEASLAVLGLFDPPHPGRRLAVLGDMAELGERAHFYHLALGQALKTHKVDGVFACGEEMKALYETCEGIERLGYAHHAQDLVEPILNAVHNEDILLIKASRCMKFEQIIRKMGIEDTI